jgi:hypothetical protein
MHMGSSHVINQLTFLARCEPLARLYFNYDLSETDEVRNILLSELLSLVLYI